MDYIISFLERNSVKIESQVPQSKVLNEYVPSATEDNPMAPISIKLKGCSLDSNPPQKAEILAKGKDTSTVVHITTPLSEVAMNEPLNEEDIGPLVFKHSMPTNIE